MGNILGKTVVAVTFLTFAAVLMVFVDVQKLKKDASEIKIAQTYVVPSPVVEEIYVDDDAELFQETGPTGVTGVVPTTKKIFVTPTITQ